MGSLPGLFAQVVRFQHLTTRDGLSHDSVTMNGCIAQDGQGFIWIGTVDGLSRYDGKSFTIFRHEEDDPGSLSANLVNAILVDHRGTVWVGTSAGLDRFDATTGTFRKFSLSKDLPVGVVNLGEDREGNIWARADSSDIYMFDTRKERFAHRAHVIAGNSFYFDSSNRMLISERTAPFRLQYYDYRTRSCHTLRDSVNLFSLFARDSQDGTLWFGARNGGLIGWNPANGKKTIYRHDPKNPASLGDDSIRSICSDRAGNLWVGTQYGGLDRLDRRTGIFTHYRHNPADPTSLSNDNVEAIFEDRSGVLWVSTYGGGVNLYSPYRNRFQQVVFDPGNPGGLTDKWVFQLAEDRRGRIWIGTLFAGANIWVPGTAQMEHDPIVPRKQDTDLHKNLLVGPSGTIWATSSQDGLFRYDEGRRSFRPCLSSFLTESGEKKKLSECLSLAEDPSGILWIGTAEDGLIRLDPGTGKAVQIPLFQGLKTGGDHSIRYLMCDRENRLWIGIHTMGLARFDPAGRRVAFWSHDPKNPGSLCSNNISCLCMDSSGVLWIGTSDKGLDRFDVKTGAFTHYPRRSGLPNQTVHGILEDSRHCLWISTNNGLTRFDPRAGTFHNYDTSDGLLSSEFNSRACLKDSRGEMYFGCLNGLIHFNPDTFPENRVAPPVVITHVTVQNREVLRNVSGSSSLDLSWPVQSLSIEFAALDYSDPSRNRYRYRMEKVNPDWVSCGNRTYTAFNNLEPGTYLFRVSGCNSEEIWNVGGASLRINIHPPFWKTTWFRILVVLAIAVASHLVFLFLRRFFLLVAFWKKKSCVGQYRLLEVIGTGGMATVYRARPLRDQSRTVAVKILRPEFSSDPIVQKRFRQEGEIIDRLAHPHIVRIFERGQENDQLYLVMEHLLGETLASLLDSEGPLPLPRALSIMRQLAETLEQVHEKGIIHRDLKPAKIMLISREGEPDFVKLLDFGLARASYHSRVTESGMLVGTMCYLAPEQITHSQYIPAGDVHMLGVVFYEMVTGFGLFEGDNTIAVLKQILQEVPVPPSVVRPEVPPELNDLILCMLQKQPEARPAIQDVVRTLRGIRIEP